MSTDSDWGSLITLLKEDLLPGKGIRKEKEKLY
jgi:hypothetical protein